MGGVWILLSVIVVCCTGLSVTGTVCWYIDEWKRMAALGPDCFNPKMAGPPPEDPGCPPPDNPDWDPAWGDNPHDYPGI